MKQNASVSVWNFFPGIEHFQQHDPCARPGPVQGTWAGAAPSLPAWGAAGSSGLPRQNGKAPHTGWPGAR